jgi:hypothetical protein
MTTTPTPPPTSPPTSARTPTPSLRRRVTLAVLGPLAVLLVVVCVAVDLLLGVQVRRDLHDRLVATADRADALDKAGVSQDALVGQLAGGTIRVRLITPSGATYGDPDTTDGGLPALPPPPPPHPPVGGPPRRPPHPPPDGTATAVTHPLPDGGRLIMVADTTQITQLQAELREVMAVAGLVTLLVAAVAVFAAVRGALRSLDRLTALAGVITSGDRGQRLRPDRVGTELGRAATAFDGMLDALEATETRAQAAAAAWARPRPPPEPRPNRPNARNRKSASSSPMPRTSCAPRWPVSKWPPSSWPTPARSPATPENVDEPACC